MSLLICNVCIKFGMFSATTSPNSLAVLLVQLLFSELPLFTCWHMFDGKPQISKALFIFLHSFFFLSLRWIISMGLFSSLLVLFLLIFAVESIQPFILCIVLFDPRMSNFYLCVYIYINILDVYIHCCLSLLLFSSLNVVLILPFSSLYMISISSLNIFKISELESCLVNPKSGLVSEIVFY